MNTAKIAPENIDIARHFRVVSQPRLETTLFKYKDFITQLVALVS